MALPGKQNTDQDAADAARWRAFRRACAHPFFELPDAWMQFFYDLGKPEAEMDKQIDACMTEAPL